MEEFTFEKFYKMKGLLDAFTIADIQKTAVLLGWMRSNGFTTTDVEMYVRIAPNFLALERMGYFAKATTPEKAKEIRRFERLLPQPFRKEARRVRLEQSYAGPLKKG